MTPAQLTNQADAEAAETPAAQSNRSIPWLPYVLAVLVFFSALRGVSRTEVIDTDAARHAMNGAFIYDLVRTGHWTSPIEYAKAYYEQYPALSMPFHPPLFPAIEALFFAIFGVNLLAARLAIALASAVSAFLLFQLARVTLNRPIFAACVTITTFSLWMVQYVARDVMLELPALAFSLAAVYCLRDMDRSYTMRRALLFALFAGAAVWTKQHAVFLGGIPILHAVLTKRWRRLFEAPLVISTAVFSCVVLAMIRFSRMYHGMGIDQISTSSSDVYWILTRTLPAYFHWIVDGLKGVPGVFAAMAIGVHVWSGRKQGRTGQNLTLYYAWIIALTALLIDLGPVSPRYLFFMFPAVVMILYTWLFRGCARLWSEGVANLVVCGFAAAWFAVGLLVPMDFLRGPAAAAAVVAQGTPARVLYAGPADGNFVFAVRALDPRLQVTVVPAGKLPRKILEEASLEAFCEKYGIEWVVFEDLPELQVWPKIRDALQKFAKFQTIPLESTRTRWRKGSIEVYRFPGSGSQREGVMPLPILLPSGNITLRL